MDSTHVATIMKDILDSLNFSFFPIWAEESQALTANAFEWAYGNGDDANNGFGIIIPLDCELFAVGLTCRTGTGNVEVYKNLSATGLRSGLAGPNALNTSITPLKFSTGDIINFRTITATGATEGGKAVAWFRVLSKNTPNQRLYGGSVPSNSLGKDYDEYLNTSKGDLYSKSDGVWIFQTNLKGITGASSLKSYIQVTNNATTLDINSGTRTFDWFDTVLANAVSNDLPNFTLDSNGIIINKTTTYKVTVYQYQIGTAGERTNASIRLTKNGAIQNGYGSNGYIRFAGSHTTSTASFFKIISLSVGEKIGFVNERQGVAGSVTCPANSLVFIY